MRRPARPKAKKDRRPPGRASKIPKARRVPPGSKTIYPPVQPKQAGSTLRRGSGVERPRGATEQQPRATRGRKQLIGQALKELVKSGEGVKISKNMIGIAKSRHHAQSVSAATFVRDTTEGRPPQRIQIEEVQPITVVQPSDPEAQEETAANG